MTKFTAIGESATKRYFAIGWCHIAGHFRSAIAQVTGLDRSAINRFENGSYNPSIEWLVGLANGLDVPIAEFFSGLEKDSPQNLTNGE